MNRLSSFSVGKRRWQTAQKRGSASERVRQYLGSPWDEGDNCDVGQSSASRSLHLLTFLLESQLWRQGELEASLDSTGHPRPELLPHGIHSYQAGRFCSRIRGRGQGVGGGSETKRSNRSARSQTDRRDTKSLPHMVSSGSWNPRINQHGRELLLGIYCNKRLDAQG